MKKFLWGFLVGALLFGTIEVVAAAADKYVAETAGFKVLVDGKEFISDPPPVVIEGRTFLPLRAMGDALGVKVEWKEEQRQVVVGVPPVEAETPPTPPTPLAYSRSNPAPIGTVQSITGKFGNGTGTMDIKVIEVIRGDEAQERVDTANSTSKTADIGYEYALVRVSMTASSITDGADLMLLDIRFDAYSDNTVNPQPKAPTLTPKPTLQGSNIGVAAVVKGETREGFIVVQLKENDEEPKLVYDFANDGGIWFKLY